jgi:hypothetical protein
LKLQSIKKVQVVSIEQSLQNRIRLVVLEGTLVTSPKADFFSDLNNKLLYIKKICVIFGQVQWQIVIPNDLRSDSFAGLS